MSTASAPVEIGSVTLTVRDLPGTASFYERTLGLSRLSGDGTEVTLGAGSAAFLILRADPSARVSGPSEAGLFHTAFLMPSREALARWLIHAAETGIRLGGASDHIVSEAIYLSDPEGNGIEVYADRPRSAWIGPDGAIRMGTARLDLAGLAAVADGAWTVAPEGMVVGHVHLQVGETGAAERFFTDTLGLDIVARYPGAAFASSGGYHHHLAGNVWHSRGAGRRVQPATGLARIVLSADADAHADLSARFGGTVAADPWGTEFELRRKG